MGGGKEAKERRMKFKGGGKKARRNRMKKVKLKRVKTKRQ